MQYFQCTPKGGRIVKGTPDPRNGNFLPLTKEDKARLTGSPSFWTIQGGKIVEMANAEKESLLGGASVQRPYPFWKARLLFFLLGAAVASLLHAIL